MTCKDCIHFDICEIMEDQYGIKKLLPEQCHYSKDKSTVAEVVRCKDCKHYKKNGWCNENSHFEDADRNQCGEDECEYYTYFLPDDFCSHGERKDDSLGGE